MDENAKRAGWSRRSMLAGAAAGLVTPLVVNGSAAPFAVEAAAQPRGKLRQVTIYAEPVAGGLLGYGLSPGQATVPGPLLEIYEGDTLEIELVNNTDQRLSIHPHGVDYDVDSDGSPLNASFNDPGETRTYIWRTRTQYQRGRRFYMPGSAGYWHYHDHAMGTDHGTAGIARGLYGGLIVRKRRRPAAGPAVHGRVQRAVHQQQGGARTPRCSRPTRASGSSGSASATATCCTPSTCTRTAGPTPAPGMLNGANDHTHVIDNKDLNPGSSFGFQVIAGEGVGPGAWMYHCHVQFHSDGGMVGLFLVRNTGRQHARRRAGGHRPLPRPRHQHGRGGQQPVPTSSHAARHRSGQPVATNQRRSRPAMAAHEFPRTCPGRGRAWRSRRGWSMIGAALTFGTLASPCRRGSTGTCRRLRSAAAAATGINVLVFHGPAADQQDPVVRATDAIAGLAPAERHRPSRSSSDPAVVHPGEPGQATAASCSCPPRASSLTGDQETALQNYIKAGNGFLGIADAAKFQPDSTWFTGLIGTRPVGALPAAAAGVGGHRERGEPAERDQGEADRRQRADQVAGVQPDRLGRLPAGRRRPRSPSYSLTSANDFAGRDPKNWTLQGSNDGTTWTDLDSRTDEDFPDRFQTREFEFANTTVYAHYRLNITANAGEPLIQLADWRCTRPAQTPPPPEPDAAGGGRSTSSTATTRPTRGCR